MNSKLAAHLDPPRPIFWQEDPDDLLLVSEPNVPNCPDHPHGGCDRVCWLLHQNLCLKCEQPLPKARLGVSNFCSDDCRLKRHERWAGK